MLLLESRGPGLVQRQSSPAWTSSRFSKLSERTMKPSLASSRANPNSRLGGLSEKCSRLPWRGSVSRPHPGISYSSSNCPLRAAGRPDVVVVAGQSVIVLEFKGAPIAGAAQRDQVEAYARDLREYHEASHWRDVHPVLVLANSKAPATTMGDLRVCGRASLADVLRTLASDGQTDFEEWLSAPYAPLPSLVSAARRIFQHERLPHVRRALAARIPETVKLVDDLILEARQAGQRRLVLVTGVPGAGKTLVGLRIVYERAEAKAESTFLSGNGPLVKVLQSALGSTVFVRDLHNSSVLTPRANAFPSRTSSFSTRPNALGTATTCSPRKAWPRRSQSFSSGLRNESSRRPRSLASWGPVKRSTPARRAASAFGGTRSPLART